MFSGGGTFRPAPRFNMKKFLILTIGAVILIPLSGVIPLPGTAVWNSQYVGLLFFLFLAISVFLWDFNKWLSILVGYCFLSAFFVTGMSSRAMVLLTQLSLCCLASYGVSKFNAKHRKYVLIAILALVLIQFSWLIMQAYDLDPIFKSKFAGRVNEMVGFSGSPDQMGTFFALTLPVALRFFPPLALLSIVGLIISKSSFAFVAGIISGLFYLYFIKKKLFVVSIAIVSILGAVFFLKVDRLHAADFGTRFSVWRHAIKSVAQGKIKIIKNGKALEVVTDPLYGYGFGNFEKIFPYVPEKLTGHKFNYANEKFTHAHNDFVELHFELGHLGFGVFLLLLFGIMIDFIRAKKTKEVILYSSCLLAYLLNAQGNFLSHIAVSGMFLVLYFGMFYGSIRRKDG